MFLVEHQLKTATVRPSYEQQQVWTDHLTVQHEEGRLPAPQPITANDKLEDDVNKLHRKTADIKRLISKSVISHGSADSVDDILTKIQTITDEDDNLKRSLHNILTLPSNSNVQRQPHS